MVFSAQSVLIFLTFYAFRDFSSSTDRLSIDDGLDDDNDDESDSDIEGKSNVGSWLSF